MLVQPIIDRAQADTILADYPLWQPLDDATKDRAINEASQYLVNNYTCPDVDYAAPPTEVEHATAYYAYEAAFDRLYPEGGSTRPGTVKEQRSQAGSVSESVEYLHGAKVSRGLKELGDDVLEGVCYLTSPGSYVNMIRG